MRNLLVIGAGQLGSRHLQALSKVRFPVKIEEANCSSECLM